MSIYTDARDDASELLAEFSQGVITLTRPAVAADASDPWDDITPADAQTWTLDATAKGVSRKYIDGSTILATDAEITAAVFGAEPQLGDVLTRDGQALIILRVIRVPDAGTVVAWKLICRA